MGMISPSDKWAPIFSHVISLPKNDSYAIFKKYTEIANYSHDEYNHVILERVLMEYEFRFNKPISMADGAEEYEEDMAARELIEGSS